MKISICGKGGSGKSTISVLIARGLKKEGYDVLLVDADESNLGLHRLAGVPLPKNLMDHLGGKKGFKEKMAASKSLPSQGIFDERWSVESIPEQYIARADGIGLLLIGKIHDFGEGCACPMGVLSRTFLSNIDVAENETVIIDTEAGIEHFGRGIEGLCDVIIGVIDPTFESFMMAEKISAMGEKAGKAVFFVLNKVDEQIEAMMAEHTDREKVIARIPQDHGIFMKSLEGEALTEELSEIDRVCGFLRDLEI
ncbi:P-loop NTPase [Desulfococcaceae bacterium HSG8]|nr:P-loop NTPase [Desulfococcaceae bacterium HSG8]